MSVLGAQASPWTRTGAPSSGGRSPIDGGVRATQTSWAQAVGKSWIGMAWMARRPSAMAWMASDRRARHVSPTAISPGTGSVRSHWASPSWPWSTTRGAGWRVVSHSRRTRSRSRSMPVVGGFHFRYRWPTRKVRPPSSLRQTSSGLVPGPAARARSVAMAGIGWPRIVCSPASSLKSGSVIGRMVANRGGVRVPCRRPAAWPRVRARRIARSARHAGRSWHNVHPGTRMAEHRGPDARCGP
jgi:hypothetical protein